MIFYFYYKLNLRSYGQLLSLFFLNLVFVIILFWILQRNYKWQPNFRFTKDGTILTNFTNFIFFLPSFLRFLVQTLTLYRYKLWYLLKTNALGFSLDWAKVIFVIYSTKMCTKSAPYLNQNNGLWALNMVLFWMLLCWCYWLNSFQIVPIEDAVLALNFCKIYANKVHEYMVGEIKAKSNCFSMRQNRF